MKPALIWTLILLVLVEICEGISQVGLVPPPEVRLGGELPGGGGGGGVEEGVQGRPNTGDRIRKT